MTPEHIEGHELGLPERVATPLVGLLFAASAFAAASAAAASTFAAASATVVSAATLAACSLGQVRLVNDKREVDALFHGYDLLDQGW